MRKLIDPTEQAAYAILGAPGAGKGTVSKWLRRQYGWGHLESGERFRQVIKDDPGSAAAQFLSRYVPVGELVPDDVVMEYFEAWLEDTDLRLLDGIPRNYEQCVRVDEVLSRMHGWEIKRGLYIKVTGPDLKERLPYRKVCLGCAAVWNDLTNATRVPGVCNDCNGKLVQRSDDTPALIDRRLGIFEELYGPVLDYYRRQKKLEEIVYTNDMSVEDLFAAVAARL